VGRGVGPAGREYRTPDFERVLVLPERTRAIARQLASIFRADPNQRAIVFCVDVEHAAAIRRELVNAAPELARADPEWVVRIVSTEDRATDYLEAFTDPTRTSPTIATTSRMLSTGVDVEDLRYVVLARPVGSIIEFKQIVGRGSRLYPDKGKTSFEIIDYVGATSHFADPGFDGPPQHVRVFTLGPDGEVRPVDPVPDGDDRDAEQFPDNAPVDPPWVEQPPADYEPGGSSADDPGDTPPGRRRMRYTVSGVAVDRVAEGFYVHDRAGAAPRLVEYVDYAGEQVRSLFPVVAGLRAAWAAQPSREEVATELATRGITLGELEQAFGLAVAGADAFDVLAHAAWRLPPESRADRARRVRDGGVGRLAEYAQPAREVLEALLDRYAQHGVDDLCDPRSLELPPVSSLGTSVELALRFGSFGADHDAVGDLQTWLYSA
jgi:type I restriction enzyme R subunit